MTSPTFDPELAAVAAARTTLSDIDGEAGELVVGGYPIEQLAANATYEEAVFLLFEDRLPTDEELREFRATLASHRGIGETVRELLRAAADADASVMDTLEMGLAALSLDGDTTDPETTARRIVAAAPTIVATYWRYRQGKEPVDPDTNLSHAADYLRMLTGEKPNDAVRGLETFLVTVLDHGLNTPTFAARTVVSTESDLGSAATAAVGTLKGGRHSGHFADLFEILQSVHESGDHERVAREHFVEGERFPGFGHPVYRTRDPRAAVLSAAAERYAQRDPALVETVQRFEETVTDVLRAERPDTTERPTLEFHTVPLLHGVGVPPTLFGATFAVARLGGVMAHCLEQLETGRIVRPTARYVGETDNAWLPLDQRAAVGDVLLGQSARAASLEAVSETLATLSEPSRLEILLALADADAPLAYSTLRDSTAIEDKGRFNYHLRQLRDHFVADGEDGYTLTDAGRQVVETVLTDDRLLDAN